MNKSIILLMLTSAALLAGNPSCKEKEGTPECTVSGHDMKYMEEASKQFQELKKEFEKWGVNTVWDRVRGKNSNEAGSQDISSAYSIFADDKTLTFAVANGKFVSADPKLDGQSAGDAPHIKQIMDALKASQDGQVVVEYKRLEKNPADKDGPSIEVSYKTVAWDQRGFGIKDHTFIVFMELRA